MRHVLIDTFAGDEAPVRAWFVLAPGGYDQDLQLLPAGVERAGPAPSWWEHPEDSWASDWHDSSERWVESGLGWVFVERWARFALREGLCPGQPFLVLVEPPVDTSCRTDCGVEYDTEWYAKIVARVPRTPEQAAAAWNRYIERLRAWREEARRQLAAFRIMYQTDVAAMYLRWDEWGDWGERGGTYVRIYSKHSRAAVMGKGGPWFLAEGRVDDRGGDARQRAMERLLEQAARPPLSLAREQVAALPVCMG